MALSNTKKVFALSFGKALTSVIGVISAMILTRLLSVEDYATYRQTLLVFSFMVPILTLGLPDSIYFFLGNEQERKRGLVNDNLFLLFIMGALYAIFIFAGGNQIWANRFNNPQLVETLKIFAPYAIFTLPLATISATLVVQNKVTTLTIFNIISRVFLFLFVVIAAFLFKDVLYIVSAEVISSALVFISILILIYKNLANDNAKVSKSGMWKILKYSVPLGLSALLGTLSVQLNQVIVSSMSSPVQYAIYANGTTEIPVIGMITGSIATIILVEMRQLIAAGKSDEALILFRKAALKSAPILIPLMFFLLIMSKQFIEVIYSAKYSESVQFFRIYLLILPARIIYYSSALLAFGLSKKVLFRSIFSLIFNALLTIIMVYIIGTMGAIIAYIAVVYLWDVSYNFRILSQKFNCKWFELLPLKDIGKIAIVSLSIALLLIPFSLVSLNAVMSLLFAAIVYYSLIYILLRKFKLMDFNLIAILKNRF